MLAIIMCAIFEFPFQNKQHGKRKISRKLNGYVIHTRNAGGYVYVIM